MTEVTCCSGQGLTSARPWASSNISGHLDRHPPQLPTTHPMAAHGTTAHGTT
ncbi:hypothetical protein [Streptomyces sp. NPDC056661]|uniref:hypothetical protein n=1 Tax=Streptomyces sp. NPDC056661 TaxID=3345898 RepID=UPI0036B2B74F